MAQTIAWTNQTIA